MKTSEIKMPVSDQSNAQKSSEKSSKQKKSKPLKRGIILDSVHPADYNNMNLIYHCEQCSYFKPDDESCVFGYDTSVHLKKAQDKQFNLNGKMAFCRFQEID